MAETKRGRLLIVDDEVELKSALCETLAAQGYETVGANNLPSPCRPDKDVASPLPG